jgi:translation initiation factor 1
MNSRKNDWKSRTGVVYSTNSDFDYATPAKSGSLTLPPHKQNLRISLDKNGRAGKQVTLVTGFTGSTDDLEKLAKAVKSGCGVGGSAKDGVILIQGDLREKVAKLLLSAGYKAKNAG